MSAHKRSPAMLEYVGLGAPDVEIRRSRKPLMFAYKRLYFGCIFDGYSLQPLR